MHFGIHGRWYSIVVPLMFNSLSPFVSIHISDLVTLEGLLGDRLRPQPGNFVL